MPTIFRSSHYRAKLRSVITHTWVNSNNKTTEPHLCNTYLPLHLRDVLIYSVNQIAKWKQEHQLKILFKNVTVLDTLEGTGEKRQGATLFHGDAFSF